MPNAVSSDNFPLDVTFLGTGTSVGIPMIGCDCDVCTSSDPRDNRTRSSIFIRTPELSILVDSGPDLRTQCLREGISHADAVLYTHAHMDHILGFDELRRFTPRAEDTLPIYAKQPVLDDLARMFTYAFNGENRYPGYIKPDPHAITDAPFTLGTTHPLTVTPLPVQHGKVDTVGYLFSTGATPRLAYIPDCKTLSPAAETLLSASPPETLVLDALRFEPPHPTHMSVDEALATTARIRPGRTYFIHFMHAISHARDEPKMPAGVQFAYDGLRLTC